MPIDAHQTELSDYFVFLREGRRDAIAWDRRLNCVTFQSGSKQTIVWLQSPALWLGDTKQGHISIVEEGLQYIAKALIDDIDGQRITRPVIARLAFFSLLAGIKTKNAPLRSIAEEILRILPLGGPISQWRIIYDKSYLYSQRYEVINNAQTELSNEYQQIGVTDFTRLDQAEVTIAEAYWWTARSLVSLASEWYVNTGSLDSHQHLVHASRRYLEVLRTEVREYALEAFLNSFGSDIEQEVKTVLLPAKDSAQTGVRSLPQQTLFSDENLLRIFGHWFLHRYDFKTGWELIKSQRIQEVAESNDDLMRHTSISLVIISFFTFVMINLGNCTRFVTPIMFPLQVISQLVAFVIVAIFLPRHFNLLLPRAFFGSLLAWMLIVIPMFATFIDYGSGKVVRQEVVHCMTCRPVIIAVVFLATFLLAIGLIGNEISRFVSARRQLFNRLVNSWCRILLGTLFWGMIFSMPSKWMVTCDAPAPGWIIFPIWLLGSSIAVVFGIITQLVWEEKAIAEPL